MPLQNRVTPLGELVAHPARGLVYGNRGCLHDGAGRIRRTYATKRWISCRLEFKGWRRERLVQPGRFTELFFLDEATAFAAGHRPCALCRRDDYDRFRAIWRGLHAGEDRADPIDARLHDERLDEHARRLHDTAADDLPDGAFVLNDGAPHLRLRGRLLRWTPAGYADEGARVGRTARAITPPSLLHLLRVGWDGAAVPLLHPSARATRPGRRSRGT